VTGSLNVDHVGPHADALDVLRQFTSADDRCTALASEFVHHLELHGDGVLRECRPAHVTASALVMSADYGFVLLTLHPKVGRWLQTGGHVEAADTSLRLAALREATEESGIQDLQIAGSPIMLDRHDVPCAGSPATHLDVQYLAITPKGARAAISEESLDLQWFSVDRLPRDTDLSVTRLVQAALDWLNMRQER